jgi:site-specific DNA-methyltransferase (adenine-specific)
MKAPTGIVQSMFDFAIREINALEHRIVKCEDDADAMLWEQAAQVVAQLDGGLSQRQLAKQWINARTNEPYSQSHVLWTKRTFEQFTNQSPRPPFRAAYNDIANARTTLVPVSPLPADSATDAVSGLADAGTWSLVCGDAWRLAAEPIIPVQAVVTSPPYWRQRVYRQRGEFGHESVPAYIALLVTLFDALRRVLRPDGALWINLGDAYAEHRLQAIPERFVVAMLAAGWQYRSEVIYERLNVTPRPSPKHPMRCHEHVLMFTLSDDYYYDDAYMREPAKYAGYAFQRTGPRVADSRLRMDGATTVAETRTLRSVWSGPTGWNGAAQHPAVMPRLMAERCVCSATRVGDTVLDPFCGAGTTGVMALAAGRSFVGWDIDARYIEIARGRLTQAMQRQDKLSESCPDMSEGLQQDSQDRHPFS